MQTTLDILSITASTTDSKASNDKNFKPGILKHINE